MALFRKYYSSFRPVEPERIVSREFGYIPFTGSMIRHLAFQSHSDLRKFLSTTVPRHVYYSTAYYRKPEERNMQDKEWMGAELIFDLDADHIEGVKEMTYEQTLGVIKAHTKRLVEKFLLSEMGFDPGELRLFFSGGRGYHVHVVSEKVYGLDSDMRREIANYVRAEGLNIPDIRKNAKGVRYNGGGWIGELDFRITEFYREIASGGNTDRLLERAGLNPEKYITRLRTRFVDGKSRIDIFKSPGYAKYAIMDQDDERLWQAILDELSREERVEIDSPVTTDTHRLIRLPGSLHGKTGLMVKEVSIDRLTEFEPLVEAIPMAFLNGKLLIGTERGFRVSMNGEDFIIPEGECEVPTYLGVYASASKRSQIISTIM